MILRQIISIAFAMTMLPYGVEGATVPVVHPGTIAVDAKTVATKGLIDTQLRTLGDLERENAKALAQGKLETALTIRKTAETEVAILSAQLKQHATAISVTDHNRSFSPLAESSYASLGEGLRTGLINGSVARSKYQTSLDDGIQKYNTDLRSTAAISSRLSDVEQNTTIDNGWSAFPLNGTISDSKDALGAVALSSNPFPLTPLNDAQSGTPMGEHYEVLRKIQLAKLTIPQKTMTDIISYHMPTHPLAEWYSASQNAQGTPTGNSPAVVDGKISADSVLNMQIASRYENPNWVLDLHRKYQSGVIRELLDMESIELKMQERLLELDERRLALYAQDLAGAVAKKYDGSLDQSRKKATIQGDIQ